MNEQQQTLENKTNTVQAAANTVGKEGKVLSDNRLIQKKANNTGLPDNLKSGIENLSGHAMDDVKVHYNSDKPAQLNAHAYAQGSEIHLASGQEKHLPHEAWHVVQQKQGRVKPTMQMKGKVNVNDDAGLENEADVMGSRATQLHLNKDNQLLNKKTIGTSDVVQRMYWWTPYAVIGLTGMIGLYAWWNSGKKTPPPNLTDVKFPGNEKEASEDLSDTFMGLPKNELQMLGIKISGSRVSSPHHPDLFQSIGANLKTPLRATSTDKLMSQEGIKYDRAEASRLVKSAEVKKGEGIHKNKTQSSVIGEDHTSKADKAELIKKFASSDSTGKRTLYIEIIKEMQPIIDHWQKELLKNKEAKMPETLNRYLTLLDNMMDKYNVGTDSGKIDMESDSIGTYKNIVTQAAKFGIRIVGMDSLHAKNMNERGSDPENYKRTAAMNQSAFETIKEDQIKNPSEYWVYTGHAHVNKKEYKTHPTLMGLSERLGIPGTKEKEE